MLGAASGFARQILHKLEHTQPLKSAARPCGFQTAVAAHVYRRSDGQQRQAKLLIGGSGGPPRRITQLQCLLFLAGNSCPPRDLERAEEPQTAPLIEPLKAQMLVGLIWAEPSSWQVVELLRPGAVAPRARLNCVYPGPTVGRMLTGTTSSRVVIGIGKPTRSSIGGSCSISTSSASAVSKTAITVSPSLLTAPM